MGQRSRLTTSKPNFTAVEEAHDMALSKKMGKPQIVLYHISYIIYI